MITEKNFRNESKLIVFHDCEKNLAMEVIIRTGQELKDGKLTVVLIQTENPVGILIHVKEFDEIIDIEEVKKTLVSDLKGKKTSFSGVEHIIRKSGKHPREFLLKLLNDN